MVSDAPNAGAVLLKIWLAEGTGGIWRSYRNAAQTERSL